RADAIRRGFAGDRIAVVMNGIDADAMRADADAGRAMRRAWGLSGNHFVVGCAARLDPMKDHANLLQAAASFARENSDARFVCVGGGPAAYRLQLTALADSLGLADRGMWIRDIGDMKAAYTALHVATFSPAFGEGFPHMVGDAISLR